MSINLSQNSFLVLQATSMDRHLTKEFQIPAGSYGMFNIISLALWVILYDRAILPMASKLKGKLVRIGVKLRMGIGQFLTSMAMAVSAFVENSRRRKAIREGFLNNPQAVVNMSALWLVPQFVLNGLAEAFTAIGQTEFFYSELPKSKSSIAAALFGLGLAVANLLASVVMSVIDDITSRGGEESWVSTNINKGRIDNRAGSRQRLMDHVVTNQPKLAMQGMVGEKKRSWLIKGPTIAMQTLK
ncbi:protein NRT1/ PTR FAMILY 1.2-like [Hibiscus syriacus]|uniref:protein NRT1/ PTR FAMILY 1.2-like n=1 Tax=Hibiscus syriacus TaxID=106335 RepID=UPI001924158C|nr:protein NRT1/ PTR FAMILY 1.2-like [Hibiscus syriacus]